jgi:D-alanyl-lipoteichoic acid acyltransferase DltB (MBOAT superfamily)
VSFFLGKYLIDLEDRNRSRKGLILGLVLTGASLFLFKYYDFFNTALSHFLALFGLNYQPRTLTLILPLGISFYTFQIMAYMIDVYKKTIRAEENFFKYALFISFFPQLIAGPIERARHLLPQLNKSNFSLNRDKLSAGLLLFFYGLFLKVVVADNISPVVDHVFSSAAYQSGGAVFYASTLFTFQIYTDFFGYSLIAVGAAKLMDIELTYNFHSPFFSRSFKEFWQRWHISLSRWFRDYMYIPLGGNRISIQKNVLLLFLVMFLSGLWHGASYNHIIWGCGHALLLIGEKLSRINKIRKSYLTDTIRMGFVFLMISLLFVTFRAENIDQLKLLYAKLLELKWQDLYFWIAENRYRNYVFGLIILLVVDLLWKNKSVSELLPKSILVRSYATIFLVLSIIFLGSTGGEKFIYFQF